MARKFDGAPNRSWEGMSGSRYSDPMTLMVVRHGGRASMRSHVRKKRGSVQKVMRVSFLSSSETRFAQRKICERNK